MKPRVSIIITTRNRAAHLRETLVSFRGLVSPPDLPTELLVVDNCSTDETAQVIKSSHLPQMPVRYLFEPKPGQSNARNSGMAHTSGEVILFTDDDVRLPANWIVGMCDQIFSGRGRAVAGGVRLAQHLQKSWMTKQHRCWLASTERLNPANLTEMIGANMAFHREVLGKVPAFDPELGPGALGFGDDTLFSAQIQEAGFRIASGLHVLVEHHVEESRLLRSAFLQKAMKGGQSGAYISHHWSHDQPSRLQYNYWKALGRLIFLRLRRLPDCVRTEGIAEWEMRAVRRLSSCGHLLKLKAQPRHYDCRGLVRKSHPRPAAARARPELLRAGRTPKAA